MIKVTCYGKTESYDESKRQYVIKKYVNAMMCSEGSEKERYANIVGGLYEGLDDVRDE